MPISEKQFQNAKNSIHNRIQDYKNCKAEILVKKFGFVERMIRMLELITFDKERLTIIKELSAKSSDEYKKSFI